ncbi:MAG: hypothetical protein IPK26_30705 [Planctomycetes bacterium]|nr:hypothetical protein [Planctomycetota bacterium]
MDQPRTMRPAAAGFTLVETMITLVLAVLMLYGMHATLNSSIRGRLAAQQIDQVHVMATDYLNRLRAIPFGSAADGPAGGAALSALFDDDQDHGSITLHQVRVAVNSAGHWQDVAANGLIGRWRFKVTRDLNHDGDETDPGLREGRDDLLGLEIWFNDRLVMHGIRAAGPDATTPDTDVYDH